MAYLPTGADLMTNDGDDYELERITVQPLVNRNVYITEEVLDILD